MTYKWNNTVYKLWSLAPSSCRTVLWRFIQTIAWNHSLLFLLLRIWMYHCLFNHSSVEGYLHFFPVLGLLPVQMLWTFVNKLLCECKSSFLWDTCPGRQLLGCMVIACLVFTGTAKQILQTSCTVLPSHQQGVSDSVSPHPFLCYSFSTSFPLLQFWRTIYPLW